MSRLTTAIIGTFLDLSGILHCLKGSERMPQMGQVGSAENCGCSSRIMAMQFILATPGCLCVLFLRSAGAAALSRGSVRFSRAATSYRKRDNKELFRKGEVSI